MTKKQIILLISGLVILIVAIGVWFPNRNTPIKYWFKDATSFQECTEASGAILESYPERCVFKGKSFTNPDQILEDPFSQNTLKNFTNSENGFSFEYPSNIFKLSQETRQTPLKTSLDNITTNILSHTINHEYCGLSGQCKPTTTDIELSWIVVDEKITQVKQKNPDLDYWSEPIKENQFTFAEIGAEGEGINYFFLELPNEKTLIFSHRYINEQLITSYQDVPDFIPYTKQNQIIIDILGSIKTDKIEIKNYSYELRNTGKDPFEFTDEDFDAAIIQKDNTTKKEITLVSSIKKAIPELQKAPNLTLQELAFPDNPTNLYFYVILSETDAGRGDIYSFNIETKKITKLTKISPYYKGYGPAEVSPDRLKIISTNDPKENSLFNKLFLLNLETDTVKTVLTLPVNQSFNTSVDNPFGGNSGVVSWIKPDTVQYEIYDPTKIYTDENQIQYHPLIKKATLVIK